MMKKNLWIFSALASHKKILIMKKLKIGLTCIVLLFFSTAFSQNKKHRLPPPSPPEIKVENPVPPEKVILPELSIPPVPPTPPVPPPPPPLPPKKD